MSEQNQVKEILQLKAELYDAHKIITQQSHILSTIVNKLGFDGQISIDDVVAKIAELVPEKDADPLP